MKTSSKEMKVRFKQKKKKLHTIFIDKYNGFVNRILT